MATTPPAAVVRKGDAARRCGHRWPQLRDWLAMGALAVVLIAVRIGLFIQAPSFYPEASYPPAARSTAIGALRTAAMAGFVGVAAIGTLVVSAVNARTNTENLRAAQDTARAAHNQVAVASQGLVTDRTQPPSSCSVPTAR